MNTLTRARKMRSFDVNVVWYASVEAKVMNERSRATLVIEAVSRTQAAKAAREQGYIVTSVNMVG